MQVKPKFKYRHNVKGGKTEEGKELHILPV